MSSPLREMDYSVLQQCIHCGMCLPTCPTFDATGKEKNGPRGRIALMRAIADGRMDATRAFGEEMYFCLGCLACETACPAGVDYAHLFEAARAEAEESGKLAAPARSALRAFFLRGLFTRPRLLRLAGSMLWLRRMAPLLPKRLRALALQAPAAGKSAGIRRVETPARVRFRVGMLTGCVQDIVFPDINRDTADVLLANGCEVHTPSLQPCCGSLHAHNGDIRTARELARRLIEAFDPGKLDAIITNAAGCGSHLKTYERLLGPSAAEWSRKVKDVHEWLAEIGLRPPRCAPVKQKVTYHEACHLCHGQRITRQPREILRAIPGLELVELPEATWCCGSAGVYNITQPGMAARLQKRKMEHILSTGARVVAAANPGCHIQLENGARELGYDLEVAHPVTLLARAYRAEGLNFSEAATN